MFIRRLGESALNQCSSGHNCSQILEMTDGSFAAVGTDIKREAAGKLPPGPGIGPDEGMVKLPRKVVIAALMDILKAA